MTDVIRRGGELSPPWKSTLHAYVALTKPRIIELLLVTTIPAMVLAARGVPDPATLVATLLGGTLTAASANAFNCYFDRDIDALMRRTSRRPLASGSHPAVGATSALLFAWSLAAAGTALLVGVVNWPAALLADAAIAFYVFVYTLGLKRRTPENIVIGGAAGCFPVLVGWAAVTGDVGVPALLLATVVFMWTPPHFWALALRFRDDYVAAGVPMLPAVATARVVTRRILIYAWATVAVSLLLIPYVGPVYAVCALLLGAALLHGAHRLRLAERRGLPLRPMPLFHLSNSYLALLFVAVMVGALLPV